jgi:uncharacterized protein YjgD (DUF1641 family)
MNEFSSRIAAQRFVLRLVNSQVHLEQLFGLSAKAIERWKIANRIADDSKVLGLLIAASKALFFLANRSQEQVSDQYKKMSMNFSVIAAEIERELVE